MYFPYNQQTGPTGVRASPHHTPVGLDLNSHFLK
jgi:hypothetical protein